MSNGEAFFEPFRMENTDECDGCKADVEMAKDQFGIWHLSIAHDDTCPFWQAYQKENHK